MKKTLWMWLTHSSDSQNSPLILQRFLVYYTTTIVAIRLLWQFVDTLTGKSWAINHPEELVLTGCFLVFLLASILKSKRDGYLSWLNYLSVLFVFGLILSGYRLFYFYLNGYGFDSYYFFTFTSSGLFLQSALMFSLAQNKKEGL